MKEKSLDSTDRIGRLARFVSRKNLIGCVLLSLVVYSLTRMWHEEGEGAGPQLESILGIKLAVPPAVPGNGVAASPSSTIILTAGQTDSKKLSQDEQYHGMVLGTWEDDYEGHRTMTLHEDGTGTMLVELDGIAARLFAPQLKFNMKWSVENGRLRQWSLGGEPAGKVKLVLRTFGDKVNQPILELSQDRLLLLDKDGETRYDWRRVAE